MKEYVKEQLEIKGLSHIFTDKKYKSYLSKARHNATGGNNLLIGMMVYDLFMING